MDKDNVHFSSFKKVAFHQPTIPPRLFKSNAVRNNMQNAMEVLEHHYFLQCEETVRQQSESYVRWEERAEGNSVLLL